MSDESRFYSDGRLVIDRETSSHGRVYCTARSRHAAEVIRAALNSWKRMGPTKPKSRSQWTGEDYKAERLRKKNNAIS